MARGISFSLEINSQTLRRNINELPEKVDGAIHAVMVYQSGHAVSYMKTNAKWTDRTGNARNGLDSAVLWNPGVSHAIRLFHRMWYGVFLESRWAGKYAIILPTIQRFGPDTMSMLQHLFRRLGSGGGAASG